MTQQESEQDGMFFSTKVYDGQTNEFFEIRTDGESIRVFPKDEDFSLSTFARFYEFICEKVDDRAKPVVEDDASAYGDERK